MSNVHGIAVSGQTIREGAGLVPVGKAAVNFNWVSKKDCANSGLHFDSCAAFGCTSRAQWPVKETVGVKGGKYTKIATANNNPIWPNLSAVDRPIQVAKDNAHAKNIRQNIIPCGPTMARP